MRALRDNRRGAWLIGGLVASLAVFLCAGEYTTRPFGEGGAGSGRTRADAVRGGRLAGVFGPVVLGLSLIHI